MDLPRETEIVLEVGPVSAKGSATAKEAIREAVRSQTEREPRAFVREVAVDIEWGMHESRKWGTPGVLNTPDLDNILKPLIDGMCGPRGIMIDDCQVQSISCGWIDWTDRDAQRITATVRSLSQDDWLPRGLVGVEAQDGSCWPICDEQPPDHLMFLVESLAAIHVYYEEALARGVPQELARRLLPLAPRFRRAHFKRHGFRVFDVATYLAQVAAR